MEPAIILVSFAVVCIIHSKNYFVTCRSIISKKENNTMAAFVKQYATETVIRCFSKKIVNAVQVCTAWMNLYNLLYFTETLTFFMELVFLFIQRSFIVSNWLCHSKNIIKCTKHEFVTTNSFSICHHIICFVLRIIYASIGVFTYKLVKLKTSPKTANVREICH